MINPRQIVTCILVLFCSLTFAQTKDIDLTIKVGCGNIGQTDGEFYEYAKYIETKDYETLRKNLNSPRLFDQLLSTISLDELSLQGKINLTDVEKETIVKFKLSKKKYYLCAGCTGHYKGQIKDIFTHNQNDKSLLNHLKLIKSELGFKVDW